MACPWRSGSAAAACGFEVASAVDAQNARACHRATKPVHACFGPRRRKHRVWAPEALSGRTDANVTPRAAWTASRGRRRSKCKPSALAASPIASTAMPKCWNSFIPAAAAPPSIAVHAPVHSDRPSGRGELGPTSSASFSWFLCCFYAMRFDKGLSRTSLPRLMYRCRSGPEA